MIDKEWVLGWRDRGLGHGDVCVITKPEEGEEALGGELVIDCFTMPKELCEHIIDLHNKSLKDS